MKICIIEGCENKHHGKGYCKTHYGKYILRPNQTKCSMPDCDNEILRYGTKGLCIKHFTRLKRHGDANITTRQRNYWKLSDMFESLTEEELLNFEINDRPHWSRVCKEYYGDKCSECGWCETSCDVDHILPHKKGGKNTIANGRVLCPNCHAKKHRKIRT